MPQSQIQSVRYNLPVVNQFTQAIDAGLQGYFLGKKEKTGREQKLKEDLRTEKLDKEKAERAQFGTLLTAFAQQNRLTPVTKETPGAIPYLDGWYAVNAPETDYAKLIKKREWEVDPKQDDYTSYLKSAFNTERSNAVSQDQINNAFPRAEVVARKMAASKYIPLTPEEQALGQAQEQALAQWNSFDPKQRALISRDPNHRWWAHIAQYGLTKENLQ